MNTIHPYKLLKQCNFHEYGMSCYKHEEDAKKLTEMHPSQFIDSSISIPIVIVKFKYNTIRGNVREHERVMFIDSLNDDEWYMNATIKFEFYVSDFNENNTHRKMLNVDILDIIPWGYSVLEIKQ